MDLGHIGNVLINWIATSAPPRFDLPLLEITLSARIRRCQFYSNDRRLHPLSLGLLVWGGTTFFSFQLASDGWFGIRDSDDAHLLFALRFGQPVVRIPVWYLNLRVRVRNFAFIKGRARFRMPSWRVGGSMVLLLLFKLDVHYWKLLLVSLIECLMLRTLSALYFVFLSANDRNIADDVVGCWLSRLLWRLQLLFTRRFWADLMIIILSGFSVVSTSSCLTLLGTTCQISKLTHKPAVILTNRPRPHRRPVEHFNSGVLLRRELALFRLESLQVAHHLVHLLLDVQ